ncbi:hypothetical protein PHMEG_00020969 [Phytophthora megakarya]|uniref:MULE transposase domain-containing protein n=1 Tax=Phytophthora megakarya TaxID=4795 RepID=A0A225VN17_9STRA|nr:hypothetical protein PHMEG_00020969 [Phytophthora megakarya]
MVHVVVQGTDQLFEHAEVVCEFENALIDTFPNAIAIGCIFHLEQALRRAMRRFLPPEEECAIAMTRGVLDILKVVEQNLIERAIKWVKLEIRQPCDVAGIQCTNTKWRGFWGYIQRTWPELYNVSVWNVTGLNNELVPRTKNPLERFYRELNDRFPKPRPSMATFVGVIKPLSAEYGQRLTDISCERARRPTLERIQLPVPIDIPEVIDDDSDDDVW